MNKSQIIILTILYCFYFFHDWSSNKINEQAVPSTKSLTELITKVISKTPQFKQGDCIGQKPGETKLESWEKTPVIEAKYRIEQIGQARYRMRWADSTPFKLLEINSSSSDLSYTAIDYIDRQYSKTNCPKEMSNVPLATEVR